MWFCVSVWRVVCGVMCVRCFVPVLCCCVVVCLSCVRARDCCVCDCADFIEYVIETLIPLLDGRCACGGPPDNYISDEDETDRRLQGDSGSRVC